MLRVLALLIIFSCLQGCIVIDNPYNKLPPGKWRGVLKLDKIVSGSEPADEADILAGRLSFEPITQGELPFQFEVVYTDSNHFHLLFFNGSDTIIADDISYGLDRRIAKDTFTIYFPYYNTALKGIYEENVMEGEWIVGDKEDYRIPFVAYYGKDYRFTDMKKTPTTDLSGQWKVIMTQENGQADTLLGEFSQQDNKATGTLIAETGDYRFLDGTVQGDKLYLSAFDGATAYLLEARADTAGTLRGIFRSGRHFRATWEAVRLNDATLLRDAYAITSAQREDFPFSFDGLDGKSLSHQDPALRGKVTLIQIFGSWCHNCYDETKWLKTLHARYHSRGLEIVGIAFERSRDTLAAMDRLRSYRDKLEIPYPLLLGGLTTDKQEVADKLPGLGGFHAYPTLVLIDRRGKVAGIHTGFTGPATSMYKSFTEEFDQKIQTLLAE